MRASTYRRIGASAFAPLSAREEDLGRGAPEASTLPSILLAVTMLAELGAVALSWGLEPAYDTLLYALAALLTVGTGADPLAPSSPRRRLAVVCPRSCECAHRGSAAGLGSPRRSRGVGRRPSGGVARAVELAADDAVVGGDPPAVPHRSPAQPPLVDGGMAECRRSRDPRDRLRARPRHRSGFRRRPQPIRRARSAHRHAVRGGPHPGCGRPGGGAGRRGEPPSALVGGRAPTDEVVRPRQRHRRCGSAAG